eukprot:14428670-Heterocapsa_arctica.AAC.1
MGCVLGVDAVRGHLGAEFGVDANQCVGVDSLKSGEVAAGEPSRHGACSFGQDGIFVKHVAGGIVEFFAG